VIALGLLARWAHLASGATLLGTFTLLLLAGQPRKPSALRWGREALALARVAVVVALVSGVIALAVQAAMLEGRADAALDRVALARVLITTEVGAVWLARQGLLALLAALLFLRPEERTRTDWMALRVEGVLLGGGALVLAAGMGHAAAVESTPLLATALDGLHLAGAGIWVGGLAPLARLMRIAATPGGADARPYAVLTVRRFSRLALLSVVVLGLTGAWNSWTQVGSVPALIGTPYGRLLLAKLALLVVIVALGAANRRRWLPMLSLDAQGSGRPALRRLGASVGAEALVAALLLVVVAAMAVTPPARHVAPVWPLPFRWSYAAMADVPGVSARLFAGSQLAVLGALGALVLVALQRRRLAALAGATLVALGLFVALPPITLEAHPTTYRPPPAAYRAVSITAGAEAYRVACVGCHPSAGDVATARTARATAGDLFWWISRGLPPGMPPLQARLLEEQRWDLVNYVRAVEAGRRAGQLERSPRPSPPLLVAPDFDYAVGPTPPRALREFRGRRVVLLAFFSLPGSLPRLTQLAAAYESLVVGGAEIVAVPISGEPDILQRLAAAAPDVRILFPVVTEGAADIVRTYALFAPDVARGGHVEFLVDRTGYLRWRRTISMDAAPDLQPLQTAALELSSEPAARATLPEHVH
jgi:putative copper resistance protein D